MALVVSWLNEMGLGKTLQVITFLLAEKQLKPIKVVVVAPASLVYKLAGEMKKFAPDLKTVVVSGNRLERRHN